MRDIVFRDTEQAFDHAIQQGVLSASPLDTAYAGRWMYMGSLPAAPGAPLDLFKHRDTRCYVRVGVWDKQQQLDIRVRAYVDQLEHTGTRDYRAMRAELSEAFGADDAEVAIRAELRRRAEVTA